MADYTDTVTYSTTIDGIVFADTITETVASISEVFHHRIVCGTGSGGDTLLDLTSSESDAFDFDSKYVMIINRDQSQDLWLLITNDNSDGTNFLIPPNGSMKFYFTGAGTYETETTTSGTRSAFADIQTINGQFFDIPGEVEVITVNA